MHIIYPIASLYHLIEKVASCAVMLEQQTVEVEAAGHLALPRRESIVLPDDVVSGEGAVVDSEVETRVIRRPEI